MKTQKEKKHNHWLELLYGVIAFAVLALLIFLGGKLDIFEGIDETYKVVNISWETVFRLLIMLVFVIMVRSLLLWLLSLMKGKKSRVGTMATLGRSLVKYAAILVIFCWGLSIIGVNVSTIFASIGVVALILGFGAESLVADLITGIFILFENQYNIGDIIEIDGFRGTVHEIGIRTLSLMDTGGNIKIINNSDVKNIVNRSNVSSVAICDISIPYELDLEEFEKKLAVILKDIEARHKDIFADGITYLGVESLADSAVVIRVKASVMEADIFSGRRLLNRELKIAFDREGISIPFPQLDVHTK